MAAFHIIIFDESVNGQFLGFNPGRALSGFPIWGNFRVTDVLDISNIKQHPHSIVPAGSHENINILFDLLDDRGINENIIVGRTGNITILDWSSLIKGLKPGRGIVKIQVGKILSELYCVEKKYLVKVLKEFVKNREKRNTAILPFLFDKTLFINFERIKEIPGFSFFIRNSYEYYRENLRINSRLMDNGFIRLYERLNVPSPSSTLVGENAVITGSFLGNGARVYGTVENSIIFNGVIIGRNTIIKNSVVLPFNNVEEDAAIENSLLLGGDSSVIERGSIIGSDSIPADNDFHCASKKGLTVIGEGIKILENSRIGAGCLVYGSGNDSQTPLMVEDGTNYHVE